MKPLREPSPDFGPLAPARQGDDLSYVVVQISDRRYVVAEYTGMDVHSFHYAAVTASMSYSSAVSTARRLHYGRIHARADRVAGKAAPVAPAAGL